MKKWLAVLLVCMMVIGLCCGCGKDSASDPDDRPQKTTTTTIFISDTTTSLNSIKELENTIEIDIDNMVAALSSEWETLSDKITSYDLYVENVEEIEAFYDKINLQVEEACIRLQKYTLMYAELLISEEDENDLYSAFNEIYDVIYDDAADEIYDEIYDGILDDMYDQFYDGVLDDSDCAESYSEWSDVHSDAYDIYSDTRSDVYENYSDTRSDIYDFYSDARSALWDEDFDEFSDVLAEYKEDVEKLLK